MARDYDLVVIGGGAAGLVAATGGASLGAKTALIEKNKLGGDCTWYGCVPSKALLRSSHIFTLLKRAGDFGISYNGAIPDASGVLSHVRGLVKEVSSHHPPEVFEKRGIKVIFGSPRFVSGAEVEVNGERLSAKRFIISTGSHPMLPPIEGLKDIEYLTNETVFDLEGLPRSILVLGGGPIGIELSQAFAGLGVKVDIIEMMDRILFREDDECADVVAARIRDMGIGIHTGKKAVRFGRKGPLYEVTVEDRAKNVDRLSAEKILVAVGRSANVQALGLKEAGVRYSAKGIEVDAMLRTSSPRIYACGDVAGPYQFSHMAEYQAIIALRNALTPFKQKVDYAVPSWCTFTEPELAHAGLTEKEARSMYRDVKVYRVKYSESDRAVTDLLGDGLIKVITRNNGRIVGAHIAGTAAGELIHELILAISKGIKLGDLSNVIHIYPTLSQLIKKAGDRTYLDFLESGLIKRLSRLMVRLVR